MKQLLNTANQFVRFGFLLAFCLSLSGSAFPAAAAEEPGMTAKVSEVASDAKKQVEEAGTKAMDAMSELWKRIDERRLKNRTADEIVGWVIMGILVGGVLCSFTGFHRFSGFAFGLLGAFLGGLIVSLARIDLGLGPVLIRYEDLLFALVGAVVVGVAARAFTAKKKPK